MNTNTRRISLKSLLLILVIIAPVLLYVSRFPRIVSAESFTTVRNNGDPSNRVDIVILGDGYTSSQMQNYANDVESFITGLFAQEPFKEYRQYFNVHRIDVISQESGIDQPDLGICKNTALDGSYTCGESNGNQCSVGGSAERCICVNYSKVQDVFQRTPGITPVHRDFTVVIANETRSGGCASNGIATTSRSNGAETMAHELGHTLGLLADEYCVGPPPCGGAVEPAAPNVTAATTRESIKWKHWIAPATPVPTQFGNNCTPENPLGTDGIPGLYQGGQYCSLELWRPTYSSKMNVLGKPFDQVNTEQLVKRIYNYVSPMDSSAPAGSDFTIAPGAILAFSVTTPQPLTHSLTINWLVDGQQQGTGTSFNLNTSTVSQGIHVVESVVRDATSWVRIDPTLLLAERRRWTVNVSQSGEALFDFVSNLPWTFETNGFGPAERDRSNGDSAAGDGSTITLSGVAYMKGVGAHASSEIRINLGGNYANVIADIGIDDEMDPFGTVGSVVFQVWTDGSKVYDSGVMTTSTVIKAINVSLAGKNELKLVVTDGGDNNWFDHADWADARLIRTSTTPPSQDYISDLTWTFQSNGWGPAERDHSNGDLAAGDGNTITLNGVTYAKGVGAHANSEIRINLAGGYSTFIANLGLDDEMNPCGVTGSIVFQVWADGVKIYDSGIMNTTTPTILINLPVAGKNELKLIVTDGGDNNWCDHADWADARLIRTPPPSQDYISDLTWTFQSNGWGPAERDHSNGDSAAGDGNTITLNGVTYAKGVGAHANSEIRINLAGGYSTFIANLGLDDEMNPCGVTGSIVFQVWADGVKIYDSGIMNTTTPTILINLPVAGKNELKLIVTDGGDNNWCDHADWASARLVR